MRQSKGHIADELRYPAQLLAADGSTVLLSGFKVGVNDLSGARREQAQLTDSETTHMILARRNAVAGLLSTASYVQADGVLYIVDYFSDPRVPRPNMWVEIYGHVEGERVLSPGAGATLDAEDGVTVIDTESGSGIKTEG